MRVAEYIVICVVAATVFCSCTGSCMLDLFRLSLYFASVRVAVYYIVIGANFFILRLHI
jgi:hypothetical protein